MRKRYLFFDIDGTLAAGGYGNTYIPDSAVVALEKLREAGHFLCIATGRSQAMAVDYMHELGFENMVSDGGYGATIGGKLIGITPLDKTKVVNLIDECKRKNIPWGIQVNNSDTRYVPDGRFEEFTHDIYRCTLCFIRVTVSNPTFCVPSQFVNWSAQPLEPPSETYVSALHDIWSTKARKLSMALSVN